MTQDKNDYYQLLDDLLDDLYKYKDQVQDKLDRPTVERVYAQLKARDMNITHSQLTALYSKLYRDGYTITNIGKHILTVEGFLFIQSGKYKAQQKTLKRQILLKSATTLVLWSGSIGAFGYLCLELWRTFMCHHCDCFCGQY